MCACGSAGRLQRALSPWPRVLLVTLLLLQLLGGGECSNDHGSYCFSCASTAYLSLWHQLMHHYFPPKNFTDRCWEPDSAVGVDPCASACFTLVEEVDEHFAMHAVMRGCVERLLLFGLDRDVVERMVDRSACRPTKRELLSLVALSPHTDYVMFCSCMGTMCNDISADEVLSSKAERCSVWVGTSLATMLFAASHFLRIAFNTAAV